MKKSLLTSSINLLFSFSLFADHPEILVNHRLAQALHIKEGDVVEVALTGDMKNAREFRVTAVYEEKPDPSQVPLRRNFVKMHLPDLEALLGKNDQVDLISIRTKHSTSASQLAAKINAEAIGFTAYSAEELATRSSTTFEVVHRFHKAIALITMSAGAIFIFALMVMRVEDQRKNFAIMTVTGVSRKTILKSLLLESILFAFFASLLGAGLGIVACSVVNLYYQNYYQTSLLFAHVTGSILFQAASVSFLLGIIAGTFSWFRLRHLAVLQELGR